MTSPSQALPPPAAQGGGAERERLRRERQQSKKQQQWNYFQGNRQFGDRAQYSSSVDIRPEWSVLEQIQLVALTKLAYEAPPPPPPAPPPGHAEAARCAAAAAPGPKVVRPLCV